MIFAVDFDGTCVDHQFPEVGKDVPFAATTLKALRAQGHKIILWTMRSGEPLNDAVSWFERHGIELYGVNSNPDQDWSTSPKAYANYYIDDAALGCPLIRKPISLNGRPFVDWTAVQHLLANDGLFNEPDWG